jgi:hypothetical protein
VKVKPEDTRKLRFAGTAADLFWGFQHVKVRPKDANKLMFITETAELFWGYDPAK